MYVAHAKELVSFCENDAVILNSTWNCITYKKIVPRSNMFQELISLRIRKFLVLIKKHARHLVPGIVYE